MEGPGRGGVLVLVVVGVYVSVGGSRGSSGALTVGGFETIMVPKWLELSMPVTLTLKNIPDAVYDSLKQAAAAHRRSLNGEAIVCLEAMLLPQRVTVAERVARARELRDGLPKGKFKAKDMDAMKREGRP